MIFEAPAIKPVLHILYFREIVCHLAWGGHVLFLLHSNSFQRDAHHALLCGMNKRSIPRFGIIQSLGECVVFLDTPLRSFRRMASIYANKEQFDASVRHDIAARRLTAQAAIEMRRLRNEHEENESKLKIDLEKAKSKAM